MGDAVIVEAVRSAHGKRNGTLASVHPVDLMADVLNALAARTGLDPRLIDDVAIGCVTQLGASPATSGGSPSSPRATRRDPRGDH
jgi:acetyl-CoA acyltransferase